MKTLTFLLGLLGLLASPLLAAPVPIFDGKTLEGWDYDPAVWRVEDGMITGGSTTEKNQGELLCLHEEELREL